MPSIIYLFIFFLCNSICPCFGLPLTQFAKRQRIFQAYFRTGIFKNKNKRIPWTAWVMYIYIFSCIPSRFSFQGPFWKFAVNKSNFFRVKARVMLPIPLRPICSHIPRISVHDKNPRRICIKGLFFTLFNKGPFFFIFLQNDHLLIIRLINFMHNFINLYMHRFLCCVF